MPKKFSSAETSKRCLNKEGALDAVEGKKQMTVSRGRLTEDGKK